ncbi:MAG TPA: hypothetical protein VFB82_07600 [Blastocatellia bacterium]|nr:hypothetical protein [Blastocatellia bacterium]
MTPEETQRTIDFLLDHDAKFAVKMDQIENAQLKMGEAIIALIGMVGRATEAQIKADARIAEVAAAQLKTDKVLGELAKRLDAFILVVERYISENRNGQNP